MSKQPNFSDWLKSGLIRICRIHFGLVAFYAVYIIAADGTHLITPQLVFERWVMNGLLLVGSAIIWYFARRQGASPAFYKALVFSLIVLDIAFASFNIYTQRGMASRAVILFVVPILVSSILLSRIAIIMTAILSAVAYGLSAVKYFVDYFNEGYKAELYIEVGFYCAIFFITAWLLSILIKFKTADK